MASEDKRALDLPRDDLFEHLQHILHQAGCVARYFFPSRPGKTRCHMMRAEQLRFAFSVDDESHLADKTLRDALEHFDERLDTYLNSNEVGEFVLGEVGHVPRGSETHLRIFKGFYMQSKTFVLLDQRYEMAPIVNELMRIHGALQQCMQNGCRFSRT